ncbi:uncharacterized protein EDB91DRAFT_1161580 [Suillus paluster]|uniref:uncharacterized protein n=1 Tax=Suillus paluster TaxID=48578 RepID=UPI001B86B8C7|nr:uncharacterized protein EDB91DRAFT_1161580 [Suillus paluster]KAG1728499.1 hypothetical protein EDB91DRAFT_1161580 [Suillus paluster]
MPAGMPFATRFKEVNFENLIANAAQRSVQAIGQLATLASDQACLPSQYERMIQVAYLLLDARHIPYGENASVDNIEAPCASLTFIGSTFFIWISDDKMSSGLIADLLSHWSDIRRWIIYIYTSCIQEESLPINTRRDCKTAVVTLLALTRDRMLSGWSRKVVADTKIMPLIFALWNLETSDARFSSHTGQFNAYRESVVLNSCFLISHETNTPIDWDQALRPFGGEPSLVSRTALAHLSQEMSQRHLDPECIAWDVHIVTALSFRDDMRESLLSNGAIITITEVIHLIVGRSFDPANVTYAARCISNASLFLRIRMQEMDGIPWMSEAIRSGIIKGLVRSERYIPFMDNDKARDALSDILHSIVPAYTVYRSMLLPIARAVNEVKDLGLDKRLDKSGKLYAGWKCLLETTERRRLLKYDGPDQVHVQTCHNDNCRKTVTTGRLKRCGGCLHTYYCSKSCQRYDWRRGKHKAYCTRIQERSGWSLGRMYGISHRDLKFLDCVIEDELKKHRARIANHGLKINIIEIDLTHGEPNITFDSRGINPSPFKALMTDEPFILVRVFIPGGISRKAVLRAIPLFQVLGHPVRQSRVYATYVYTCCGRPGQEANNSPLRSLTGS